MVRPESCPKCGEVDPKVEWSAESFDFTCQLASIGFWLENTVKCCECGETFYVYLDLVGVGTTPVQEEAHATAGEVSTEHQ